MNENKKSQTLYNTIKTAKYAFGFVWKEKQGKWYIVIKSIMAVTNAIFPLVFAIVPGLIINELTDKQEISTLVLYVGILIVTPVISHIFNVFANRYLYKLSMEINLKFEVDFYGHVADMDYETLEKPDIQIMKDRAQQTMGGIIGVIDQLSGFLWAVFSLITISSIIITLSPFVIVLIVCITYINSLVAKRANHKKFFLGQELTQFDRFQGAYIYMLEQFAYAKEVRLFNIKSLLIGLYANSKKESNKVELKFHENNVMPGTFNAITNLMQQFVLYTYLIYNVIVKKLSIGSMTIYLTAAGQFSGALNNIANSYLGLSSIGLNIQELIEFLQIPLKQQKTGNKTPVFDKNSIIEFKNVSFKYPGSKIYALKDMNIVIYGHEKLCIVGSNGAGKSTFIKLLTRLYFPTEGEILLNGININEYDYKQYQRLFAPVFQDFASYSMTLGQNIILSDEYDCNRLDKVCAENGLLPLVQKLPKGYDTQVDKWLDEEGFDPSGGESQRIAIARACYHGGDIFLLDEPTAALDPLAEYEIYTQFNNMITDKCAVLITHRLSAVQLADKIAVFDNGSLIEYGTHRQLYNNGGIYTEMFDKQATFYRDDNQM